MSREALLAQILEEPDEDAPRLVYADWLEEYGGEYECARAEFIRLQCDYQGRKSGASLARQRQLLRMASRDWDVALPAPFLWLLGSEMYRVYMPRGTPIHVRFDRGFVQAVCCPLKVWLAYGQRIVAGHPVARLTITDKDSYDPHGHTDDAPDTSHYGWFERTGETHFMAHHDVPAKVWQLLRAGVSSVAGWRFYDSALEANADLAQALLGLARSLAARQV